MPTITECARLADAAYGTAAPPDGFIRVALSSSIELRGKGFAGSLYKGGDVGIVAYRGSVETTDWIHTDMDIFMGRIPDQLGDAFALFGAAKQSLKAMGCKRIVIVGHSLGGALAALVGARITTFPVVAATFNAPGCKGFERYGRWVDEDDEKLADTVDNVRTALTDPKLTGVQRLGVASGGAMVASFQTAQLVARRAMEAAVGNAGAKLALPSGNSTHVYNFQAVSRLRTGEFVSGIKSNYIGHVERVPVAVTDPLRAHMIGYLIDALSQSPVGSRRI